MDGNKRAQLFSKFLTPVDTEELPTPMPTGLAISNIILEGAGSWLKTYRQAWLDRQKAIEEREKLRTGILGEQLKTKELEVDILLKKAGLEKEGILTKGRLGLMEAQRKAAEALAKQRLTPKSPTPKTATPLSPEAIYRNAATHFNNWYRMNKPPTLSETDRLIFRLPPQTQEEVDKTDLELMEKYRKQFPDYAEILFKTKEEAPISEDPNKWTVGTIGTYRGKKIQKIGENQFIEVK